MIKEPVTKEVLVKKVNEEFASSMMLAKPILENNLFKFNRFILEVEKGKGNVPLAPVHQEMCDFIDRNKRRKKIALIPRNHLKSTVITVGRSLQAIVKDPSVRILIANATYSNACSFLTEIKRHLKFNEKIHMMWGDLSLNAQKWSENSITLSQSKKKEPTVTAMGVESNLTSQHYDIIILDDVVNKDLVNTPEQIQKTISFYKECLNLLEPDGEVIVVGTRWHDSDLYGWILDKENKVFNDFDIFIKQAYEGNLFSDEEGACKLLFPAKHGQRHLRKLYESQGPYVFSCQYMNDPVPEENADFKKDWFKYYEPQDVKGRLMNKFTMIDPAISTEKTADYTAIVTIGIDELGFIYILDIFRERVGTAKLIEEVFRIWMIYRPLVMGIEDVAFQRSLQYTLSEEMRKRNTYINIKPLRPGGRNKDQRIRGLQPLYANGRVLHNKLLTTNVYLEDELLRFPRTRHDDVIDALSYMIDIPIYQPKRRKTFNNKKRYLYA